MTHALDNWSSMSFDEQAKLQDKKISAMVQEVYKYHPAYKKMMKDQNIDPSDIKGVDDFIKKFPFTSKKDIAPTDENPFTPDYYIMQKLDDPDYMPKFMIATTGRTAFSTPFWYSGWDLENIMMPVARRVSGVSGMNDKDVIINSFPYSPHLAFWLVYYASTGIGRTAIHTGGGKILGTQKIVGLTFGMKGSVFVGVPGYMYHVFKTALSTEKYLSDIRLLITGGDRCTTTFRKRITDLLNRMNAQDPVICAAYGFTESRVAPVECPAPDLNTLTGYHTYPDLEFWYCIDPKTGERVGPEEKGELVWTALGGHGTVVMNYRTGDVAEEGIKYEKCPHCDRNVPIISSMISRVSEVKDVKFDKVKGTLIDLNQFYTIMPEFDGLDEWQIVLQQGPSLIDELIVNVSPKRSKKINEQKFKEELNAYIKEKMEISPNDIRVMTPDGISRSLGMETQLKEKRILDLRPRD
ncbi:MAG: phenylacetate--CoA ligase family protein [Candidatus Hodarchaeota archaeon]